jgi:hypothetical protein
MKKFYIKVISSEEKIKECWKLNLSQQIPKFNSGMGRRWSSWSSNSEINFAAKSILYL